MITSMTTPHEEERLLELYRYELLDTSAEEEFDEIVQLASRICNTPISTITLVDSHRQWFKARVGTQEDENPRELSFCAHVVADETDLFTVEDASQDHRFHDYPNVTGNPHIRFYAGVPLVTRNGHRIGALCVINSRPQNLTEEQSFALRVLGHQVVKLAELRLNNKYLHTYQSRLVQQAAMQNKILSIVAHDVKAPLVSLHSIVELSQDDILTEEMKFEMIEIWKKQLDNTMSLLGNLIEWGKLQVSTDIFLQQPIDLHAVADDELQKCSVAAGVKNIQLQNDLPARFPLYGDENIIRFIIRNIVANAIKFTENGRISIAARRNKNRVALTVTDTGVGMTAEQAQNLVTGKHAMVGLGTRNEKGSGLGFMLLRDFVAMLDGAITIDSTPGKGTSVRVEVNG